METADTTCALSGSISGTGSQLKSGFACAGLLCSNSIFLLLDKRSCHFLFVARVGLCCLFCDFAVSFLLPPEGPKNGCMQSQKMGPPRFIF